MMSEIYKEIDHKEVRNLWLWHSIEETEHKSVAFDLYKELYGSGIESFLPRVTIYTFGLFLVHVLTFVSHLTLLSRDKQILNLKSWKKFMQFGYRNYKNFLPKLLDFYRIDFHPNDCDDSSLLELTKARLSLKN